MNKAKRKKTKIEKEAAIMETIAFFDIFDYPLTLIELWERLPFFCEIGEAAELLSSMEKIESGCGFYFLKGRNEIILKRQEQYILRQEKWKIACRAGKILRFIIGVKLVAICNNFSYKNDSDVDVFIVTAKKRIWLIRGFVTIALQLALLRRHGKKIRNRVCLSFYVSEDGMDLQGLLLSSGTVRQAASPGQSSGSPVPEQKDSTYKKLIETSLESDPYFIFWILDLLPIYDNGSSKDFWQKNSWLRNVLPNASFIRVSQRIRVNDNFFSCLFKKTGSFLGVFFPMNFMEKIARLAQKKKMDRNYASLSKKKDTRVIISDTVLKFHEQDRREKYLTKWLEKIRELA